MYEKVPWSRESFIQLTKLVEDWQVRNTAKSKCHVTGSSINDVYETAVRHVWLSAVLLQVDSETEGTPVLVHCMDGAGQSGLYCAVSLLFEKMRKESSVDVFHTVKQLKRRRPHFLSTLVSLNAKWQILSRSFALALQSPNCVAIFNNVTSIFQEQYKFCFKILWDYMNTRLDRSSPADTHVGVAFTDAPGDYYDSYT